MDATGAVDGALLDELVAQARVGGVSLVGEGGLLRQLTKRLKSALEGELTAHRGHEPGERAGAGTPSPVPARAASRTRRTEDTSAPEPRHPKAPPAQWREQSADTSTKAGHSVMPGRQALPRQ